MVWTQNSGMQIADKERLYAGFHRVIRPGGRLAIQEPMAGPVQPPIYPLMWATDENSSFLRTPDQMKATIEAAGFVVRAWNEVSTAPVRVSTPTQTIQKLVMADRLDAIQAAGQRNTDEGRQVARYGVFDRV